MDCSTGTRPFTPWLWMGGSWLGLPAAAFKDGVALEGIDCEDSQCEESATAPLEKDTAGSMAASWE